MRTRSIAAGCAIVALGIAVRKLLPPGFWSKYAGVALWSCLVYALVVAAAPHWTVLRVAVTTLTVSWVVEFLQLTPGPPWLAARQPIFAWILGTSFSFLDLPAYAVGVLLAMAMHRGIRRGHKPLLARAKQREKAARRS